MLRGKLSSILKSGQIPLNRFKTRLRPPNNAAPRKKSSHANPFKPLILIFNALYNLSDLFLYLIIFLRDLLFLLRLLYIVVALEYLISILLSRFFSLPFLLTMRIILLLITFPIFTLMLIFLLRL